MVKIFPSLSKEKKEIINYEAKKTPNRINPNKSMPRPITVKILKIKDKETYSGKTIKKTPTFSSETT